MSVSFGPISHKKVETASISFITSGESPFTHLYTSLENLGKVDVEISHQFSQKAPHSLVYSNLL